MALRQQQPASVPLPATQSRGTWEADPLWITWAAAEAEASVAYSFWATEHSADSYFVYRASADRADAAHDALAERAARRAHRPPALHGF